MTRHGIAQIGENRNPKSPENRPQTRRFLQIRLLQLRRSATPFNAFAVLHGRLSTRAIKRKVCYRPEPVEIAASSIGLIWSSIAAVPDRARHTVLRRSRPDPRARS